MPIKAADTIQKSFFEEWDAAFVQKIFFLSCHFLVSIVSRYYFNYIIIPVTNIRKRDILTAYQSYDIFVP